jgi:hypothetical protein
VDVADNLPNLVTVRDSKDPAGPTLHFTPPPLDHLPRPPQPLNHRDREGSGSLAEPEPFAITVRVRDGSGVRRREAAVEGVTLVSRAESVVQYDVDLQKAQLQHLHPRISSSLRQNAIAIRNAVVETFCCHWGDHKPSQHREA